MPGLPHTMPDNHEEAQRQVFEAFGIHACLWQLHVVWAILNGEDVITIAPTGSRKSLTYWMPLIYIKHGITVVVTPLKLLRGQFVEMLQDNNISAVSITAVEQQLTKYAAFSMLYDCG
jgi:superfamily II DNA helicase RecQ